MSNFLDFGRQGPVHHYFVQFVPTRSNVLHQDFIRRQRELDGGLGETALVQFDPMPKFIHRLDPKMGLRQKILANVKKNRRRVKKFTACT